MLGSIPSTATRSICTRHRSEDGTQRYERCGEGSIPSDGTKAGCSSLGERLVGDQEAGGAIPLSQTNSDSGRKARRALREGEIAGAIPVCPTKICTKYLAVAQEESARFGSARALVRFQLARLISGCSSGAEHVADYDVVSGAIPLIRTMYSFQGRDTTVRTSLAEVRILSDTRSAQARIHL